MKDAEFVAFAAAATPRLRRIAYLMTRDWHLAEDLTQLTLARMFASWGRLAGRANLDAYSRRVFLNAVFDERKRRSGGELVMSELPDRPGPGPAPELHVMLMRALSTLPERDQAIVVLRHWEDQSVETVAEILGVSASLVKMQSMRALSRLRELLGEDAARM